MSQLKIGVVGASGKMGQELRHVIQEAGHIPYFGIYKSKKPEGFTHSANNWVDKNALDVDLWIDFSLPEAFDQSMKALVGFKKPIVSGTTGLSLAQKEFLSTAGKNVAILWSSNMSVGVAFLNKLLSQFSAIKDFDFQIEELHHKHKKDAPSGTAKTLQENLEKAVGKTVPPTLSIRGGGIFGIHKVWAMSDQEVITIEHQALNRKVFAEGALRAGLAILNKGPGLYSMKDIF